MGNIETALNWAVGIANDNRHGYSQAKRYGPDYDCSSLVCQALKTGGFDTGGAQTTQNIRKELCSKGWTAISFSNPSQLKRGDVLLKETATAHVVFCLGDGKIVHASGTHGHPETGDQTGKEICVANYYSNAWNWILRPPGVPVPTPSNLRGNLDFIGMVNGTLNVSGWTIDTSAGGQPNEVHVYIGGTAGAAGVEGHSLGMATLPRPDVERALPGYGPNHGFSGNIKTNKLGTVEVVVYAIQRSRPDLPHLILYRNTVYLGSGVIGHFDEAKRLNDGTLKVSGWTIDTNAGGQPNEVHIYVGGAAGTPGAEGHGLGAVTVPRPDVEKAHPGYGPNHGFAANIKTKKTGSVDVYAYGICRAQPHLNTFFGTIKADLGRGVVGAFDEARRLDSGTLRVSGWTLDTSGGNEPNAVHIYIGGPSGDPKAEGHNLGLATLSRPDVEKAYPGHGPNHGFAANIKTKKTGVVDVYMYAIQRTRPDLPNPHIGTIKVDMGKA